MPSVVTFVSWCRRKVLLTNTLIFFLQHQVLYELTHVVLYINQGEGKRFYNIETGLQFHKPLYVRK
jgi:hypothetical protein